LSLIFRLLHNDKSDNANLL